MGTAERISRKAIRFANGAVNFCVLIAVLLLLSFGGYALWDYGQVYHAAGAEHYATYKPTNANGDLSFQDLKAVNKDVVSWLTVYGTHIDYPVVQGENNLKYINTDAKGRYSLSGAIFLDTGCSPDFSDFNSIVYGHHMENTVMFGEIGMFSDKGYFDAREYGSLYFDGKEHGLEFFAFVHADAYDESVYRIKISGQAAEQAYLDLLSQIATNIRSEVQVTPDDRIVMLSTCSANSTNGRDILIGKITDTVHDDPFATEKTDNTKATPTIKALPGVLAQIPVTARVIIAGSLSLLILLAIVLTYKSKKRRSRKNGGAPSGGKGDK